MSGLSGMVTSLHKVTAEDDEDDEASEQIENDMLDEAFAAAQKGDPGAFRRAMKGAFKQCVLRLVDPKSLVDDEEEY